MGDRGNQIGLSGKGGATRLEEIAEKKAETEKTPEGKSSTFQNQNRKPRAGTVGEWPRVPRISGSLKVLRKCKFQSTGDNI